MKIFIVSNISVGNTQKIQDGDKMSDKLVVKVDSRDRITIPKEARKAADIESGDVLFINLSPVGVNIIKYQKTEN
jgi:AbrB family looped-hinge helix DNA binding protein